MLVFLSVIENIDVFCPSFLVFSPTQFYSQLKTAVEPRKNFIMPGHYKKIMPAQQPIRARVLLWPYNNAAYAPITFEEIVIFMIRSVIYPQYGPRREG